MTRCKICNEEIGEEFERYAESQRDMIIHLLEHIIERLPKRR